MSAWDLLVQIAQNPVASGLIGAAGGSVATVAAGAMKVVAEPLMVPAAKVIGDDLAERMKERVEARRRAVAASAVELAGPNPKGVLTDRTLVNVMQAVATVDDPDLQEMFARLLASEATGTVVHPSFPGIIASMSPSDARLFRHIALPTSLPLIRVVHEGDLEDPDGRGNLPVREVIYSETVVEKQDEAYFHLHASNLIEGVEPFWTENPDDPFYKAIALSNVLVNVSNQEPWRAKRTTGAIWIRATSLGKTFAWQTLYRKMRTPEERGSA